jgi:hypothetical protein
MGTIILALKLIKQAGNIPCCGYHSFLNFFSRREPYLFSRNPISKKKLEISIPCGRLTFSADPNHKINIAFHGMGGKQY